MSFSVREVSAMLGLSASQIRSFATQGFLQPERGKRGEMRFGFQDLVILRTAGELSSARVPQRKVKRILERLRDQLPEGRSLTGVRIAADGDRVVVSDGNAVWNPESGQALFDFSVAELAEQTARFGERTSDVDDLFQRACDFESSDSDEAKRLYEQVVALDPDHVDAHVNLGRLLHEEKAPAAAEAHYRAALAVDPDHETAAFNLGVALEDLGRLREALAAYQRAIELDPTNADAHYNIAGIYERRGEKAAALRHLKACRAAKS